MRTTHCRQGLVCRAAARAPSATRGDELLVVSCWSLPLLQLFLMSNVVPLDVDVAIGCFVVLPDCVVTIAVPVVAIVVVAVDGVVTLW